MPPLDATSTNFLRTIVPALPKPLASHVRTLCTSNPANEDFLENLIRLVIGASAASDASEALKTEWEAHQRGVHDALGGLLATGGTKRTRDEVEENGDGKRQRTVPPTAGSSTVSATPVPEEPVQFTLHSVSTTSPLRKKLDITLHTSRIALVHPTTRAVEASIPLTSLRRCFVVPTRGKTKAHWTVILMSSDLVTPPPKATSATTKSTVDQDVQIIFGVDAASTGAWTITRRTENGELRTDTQGKGADTLSSIHQFIARLPEHITRSDPCLKLFKSSTNSGSNADGIPGLEAYRAAKQGNVWFTSEGLLWGESKPCEFWALEELLNPVDGVRVGMGSGRVFGLTITRKTPGWAPEECESEENEDQEKEVDEGVETELGMIDSREREGVFDWVRKHQHLFGRPKGEEMSAKEKEEAKRAVKEQQAKLTGKVPAGPMTIKSIALDSDSEDEDFVGSDDSRSEARSGGGSDDSDSGDSEEEGDEGDEDDAEEDGLEVDKELDPARHPLMRPGAVPKMTKAVMDMVVDMVEDDLMNGPEEDELDE